MNLHRTRRIAAEPEGPHSAAAGPAEIRSHYCLHCLTPVGETQPECSHCAASFRGAGRFDRVAGAPPSSEFAFLFRREKNAADLAA